MIESATGTAGVAGGGIYRLHGAPDNANFVVRMVLEELGESYEFVSVDRAAGEQKSEQYRRLNPQGLIPVLEVPGQDAVTFETGAILLMLSERHRSLAPKLDSPGRGRFLKWLFFLSNTLHADLRISFKPHRYMPDKACMPTFNAALRSRIDASFSLLEQELEARKGLFLLGADPSCLDFYLAACARWAQIYGTCGRWPADRCPRLLKLLAELETRPSVRKACELELIEGAPFTAPAPVAVAREK
ncbi:MAG: glutathione S-transferase family protein [Roseibium sp.]|uniref:glutathione S-transferase family protein n=1 Tax=Roseibium sp. TaxID=1936156 RepID=UPI003D9C3E16